LTSFITYYTTGQDKIQELNVDRKAECGQLNLAHVTKNKKYIETKTNKRM